MNIEFNDALDNGNKEKTFEIINNLKTIKSKRNIFGYQFNFIRMLQLDDNEYDRILYSIFTRNGFPITNFTNTITRGWVKDIIRLHGNILRDETLSILIWNSLDNYKTTSPRVAKKYNNACLYYFEYLHNFHEIKRAILNIE